MLALNEICDDYEEPVHVHERLAAVGREYGIEVRPTDAVRALVDLVSLEWAAAYDLTKEPPQKLRGVPAVERAGRAYYFITQEGREAQSSFEGWPFDQEGVPIPDWAPPTE
jgi:hypothetical protein